MYTEIGISWHPWKECVLNILLDRDRERIVIWINESGWVWFQLVILYGIYIYWSKSEWFMTYWHCTDCNTIYYSRRHFSKLPKTAFFNSIASRAYLIFAIKSSSHFVLSCFELWIDNSWHYFHFSNSWPKMLSHNTCRLITIASGRSMSSALRGQSAINAASL